MNGYVETLKAVAARHQEVAEGARITVCTDALAAEIARLTAERDAVAGRLEKALVIGDRLRVDNDRLRAQLEAIAAAGDEWAAARAAQALAHPR